MTVANVQLGKMGEKDTSLIMAAKAMGKDIVLDRQGKPEDEQVLHLWKYRSNYVPPESLNKENVIIKAQIPLDGDPVESESMVYDQNRSFTLNICKGNCDEYPELVKIIQTKGINGNKAYFHACLPGDVEGKMKIDLDNVLEKQPW